MCGLIIFKMNLVYSKNLSLLHYNKMRCFNTNWFLSLEDAKDKIESFRRDYNEFRPHSSLLGKTPDQVESGMQIDPEISTLEVS